jgi:membrane-associated phospholipid phosphatase
MNKLVVVFSLLTTVIGRSWAAGIPEDVKNLPGDATYVFTSPLRLDSYRFALVPIGAGALAVTMTYDGPIRDRLIHLRQWGGRDKLRRSGDLLQYSGVAMGVSLMTYGKIKDDNTAGDNGWMQLEGAAVAGSTGFLLKWVVGRGRPGRDDPDYFKAFSSNSSFPSGHTLMAFTAAEIASREYPSLWIQIPSYVIATSVGVSRIAADQHWVGDVLASALLGTGIGHAVVTAHHRSSKNWRVSATGNGLQLTYAFQ